MSDPLDAVFVTGDEAAELKRTDTARKLATYLERMPAELRSMFTEEFQHINRAELAQLRADLQAAQERIAEMAKQLGLEHTLSEQQAAQLKDARWLLNESSPHRKNCGCAWCSARKYWLAANAQPQESQP